MLPKKYWKKRLELRKNIKKYYRSWFYKTRYKLISIRGGFKVIPIYEIVNR
jgi:hypothetical protein